jgi:hypothetical protein
MSKLPNIGTLTAEQTKELALLALNALTITDKINVVKEAFSDKDVRAELLAHLEDDRA